MPSACFCSDCSSIFAQICWILRLSAGTDRGLLLSSFSFLCPHTYSIGFKSGELAALSMKAGFDVIWDVLFEPFICHPCFVWGRAIMYKRPTAIVRAKYLAESRFCFLGQDTCAPSGRPCRLISACDPGQRLHPTHAPWQNTASPPKAVRSLVASPKQRCFCLSFWDEEETLFRL